MHTLKTIRLGGLHVYLNIINIKRFIPCDICLLEDGIKDLFFRFSCAYFIREYPLVEAMDNGITFLNVGKMELVGVAEKKNRVVFILQMSNNRVNFGILLKNVVPYVFEFFKFQFQFVSLPELREKI
jgi:hypothetical protein